MTSILEQRLIGAFLRAHRERLSTAAVGLREGGSVRRRTPGLRREEVAQLCGLSPTWYTWMEQGREVSVSPAALARVAAALQLTAAERTYLFALARKRDPAAAAPEAASPEALPPALAAALEAMTVPAYVLDRLWRACGWNAAAARHFAGWLGGGERSLLHYVFLEPTARGFICGWENRARRLLAELRADTGRNPEDAAIGEVIEDLQRRSRPFARFWNDHAVLGREGGTRSFNHPKDGLISYEQLTLTPAGLPEHKLVMLVGPARLRRAR